MSLEDLLQVEVVSASKKSEAIMKAPVTIYSISRDDIARSGAASIPEVLRLCPGVIVREMANGSYDVHIRGLENSARYTNVVDQQNKFTLVMIDDRPVFNFEQGGTFWEFLPIDLVDIERIEIVRGPAAPLFGPNAVTGVINIITQKMHRNGLLASANAQAGINNISTGNLSVGYKHNHLGVRVSGNFQNRDRFSDDYYVYNSDQFVSEADNFSSLDVPSQPSLAQEKYGVNAFIDYKVNNRVNFNLSLGGQHSDVQKPYLSGLTATALGRHEGETKYVNLDAEIYGVRLRASRNGGINYLFKDQQAAMSMDFDMNEMMMDYTWKVSDDLSIRPGFNFQHNNYDLNSPRIPSNPLSFGLTAGSLQVDYDLSDDWRVVVAGRLDHFTGKNRNYFSYQLTSTYGIADDWIVRFSHSKSSISTNWAKNFFGDADLRLASMNMTEVGLRGQIGNKLSLDVDIFNQNLKNTSLYMVTALDFTSDTPEVTLRYENLPMTSHQYGLTLSMNYVATTKFHLKPFVTFQTTRVKDRPIAAINSLPYDPVTNPTNIYTTEDGQNRSTPSVYGGLVANYEPIRKLRIDVNTYFFSNHTLYSDSDLVRDPVSGVNNIDGKVLLNAKVGYNLFDDLDLYVNGRNLIGATSREFYGGDNTSRSILLGISYNF